jgi:hypothetical protein
VLVLEPAEDWNAVGNVVGKGLRRVVDDQGLGEIASKRAQVLNKSIANQSEYNDIDSFI